jgi:23S rRNA pseudouridine2605 synthase
VQVNGRVIENPDQWIDFDRDQILFDEKPLQRQRPVYILLYKPTGYITTFKDPEGRPTVYDLISDVDSFVSPVGRLDLDTSGLLILTNDTQFAERLTNPDHKIPKTYLVKCEGPLTDEALEQLRKGVELSDGPTRPAEVKRVRDSGKYTHIEVQISEGRNRQVRRMVEAIGGKVMKLVRTAIGPIQIGELKIGTWRLMETREIAALSAAAHINASPTRNGTSGRAQDSRVPGKRTRRRPGKAGP